jgi:methylmalonyl-CoA mutase cobalamin-binding subunit
MESQALPEVLQLESRMHAAAYRRAEALMLFDHAVDMHDHGLAKVARQALEQAGIDIDAIQKLLRRLKAEY